MGTLSANTLFHFTKNIDNLISILQTNFRPSYCSEKNHFERYEKWQIPMVCFCDIPLSQIEEHILRYGEYAIGMTKEWAVKNNVNPVLYINDEVELCNKIKSNYALLIEERNAGSVDSIQFIIDNLLYQYAYIKPYQEDVYDRATGENIIKRFYNEREWRYIPIDREASLFNFSCAPVSGQDECLKKNMEQYRLNFEPKDINYIIVSRENEILSVKEQLGEIKERFAPKDIELLTTHIISMERIKEDF